MNAVKIIAILSLLVIFCISRYFYTTNALVARRRGIKVEGMYLSSVDVNDSRMTEEMRRIHFLSQRVSIMSAALLIVTLFLI